MNDHVNAINSFMDDRTYQRTNYTIPESYFMYHE